MIYDKIKYTKAIMAMCGMVFGVKVAEPLQDEAESTCTAVSVPRVDLFEQLETESSTLAANMLQKNNTFTVLCFKFEKLLVDGKIGIEKYTVHIPCNDTFWIHDIAITGQDGTNSIDDNRSLIILKAICGTLLTEIANGSFKIKHVPLQKKIPFVSSDYLCVVTKPITFNLNDESFVYDGEDKVLPQSLSIEQRNFVKAAWLMFTGHLDHDSVIEFCPQSHPLWIQGNSFLVTYGPNELVMFIRDGQLLFHVYDWDQPTVYTLCLIDDTNLILKNSSERYVILNRRYPKNKLLNPLYRKHLDNPILEYLAPIYSYILPQDRLETAV